MRLPHSPVGDHRYEERLPPRLAALGGVLVTGAAVAASLELGTPRPVQCPQYALGGAVRSCAGEPVTVGRWGVVAMLASGLAGVVYAAAALVLDWRPALRHVATVGGASALLSGTLLVALTAAFVPAGLIALAAGVSLVGAGV